jgi:hypothetical protein
VDAELSAMLYIRPDAATHGHDGYVHVSYPKFFYYQSRKCSRLCDGIILELT